MERSFRDLFFCSLCSLSAWILHALAMEYLEGQTLKEGRQVVLGEADGTAARDGEIHQMVFHRHLTPVPIAEESCRFGLHPAYDAFPDFQDEV
jgi:hypothetical protein